MLKEVQLTNFQSSAGDAPPIPFGPVTLLVGGNDSLERFIGRKRSCGFRCHFLVFSVPR